MKLLSATLLITLVSVGAIAHAEEIERESTNPTSQEACEQAGRAIESALTPTSNWCQHNGGTFVLISDDCSDIKDVSFAYNGRTMVKATRRVGYTCQHN